jgi:tRNA wybutosine-synthesizing protein 4
VDIDYPDLMRKKSAIVLETPQLREILGEPYEYSPDSTGNSVLLRSDKYCQIGCDLRDLDVLKQLLETLVDLAQCDFLFVAEVSVTYMDTSSADALIQWASSIGQSTYAPNLVCGSTAGLACSMC